jgi:predicted permease
VLTMRVDATAPRLKADWRSVEGRAESARLAGMWAELNERVRRLPGVRAAALSTLSPMSGRDRGISIAVAGALPRAEADRSIHLNQIAPAYFDTLGIQLARGRAFTDRDGPNAPKVAILNDTAARFYFGNDDPVGRRVIFFPGPRATEEYEVVGVARDTRYQSLREPDERMVYVPIPQALDRLTGVSVAVRAHADATALLPAIRAEVRGVVPGGFITNVKTVAQQVDASLLRERMLSSLATAFGLLALILASIGLHGVLSYGVTRRTREIGIRVAIGAERPAVIWLVLRETIVLVGLGLMLGIAAVLALGRYIDSLLFGIGSGDPLAIGAAVAVLIGVAAAAGYVPARRASQVDPVVALRCE